MNWVQKSASKELKHMPADCSTITWLGPICLGWEVLRDAQEKWGINWKLIDPAEILRTQKMRSPEQIVFSFLKALREEDVEVARIRPEGQSLLSVTLKIRFPA